MASPILPLAARFRRQGTLPAAYAAIAGLALVLLLLAMPSPAETASGSHAHSPDGHVHTPPPAKQGSSPYEGQRCHRGDAVDPPQSGVVRHSHNDFHSGFTENSDYHEKYSSHFVDYPNGVFFSGGNPRVSSFTQGWKPPGDPHWHNHGDDDTAWWTPDEDNNDSCHFPPSFGQATYEFQIAENTASGEDIGQVEAIDEDGDQPTHTLEGTDRASFNIDAVDGQIVTKAALDYETKPTYSVAGRARDPGGRFDTAQVAITVTDVEEQGEVTLSPTQPRVGQQITASVTDPDGGVTGVTWQWAKSDAEDGAYTDIEDATDATYTPVAGDAANYLRATATYTDRRGEGQAAASVAGPVRTGPAFSGTAATREIAENTSPGTVIGIPVTASHANGDTLTYSLGGADGSSFTIDRATGQLKTRAALNFEAKSSYTVTVTARDQGSQTATITVTITVTNVDEAGQVSLSPTTPRVGTAVTATLSDSDGNISDQAWLWQRAGTQAGSYTAISGETSRTYTPVAADQGKYLKATVSYTDRHGAGKSAESSPARVAAATTTRSGGGNGGGGGGPTPTPRPPDDNTGAPPGGSSSPVAVPAALNVNYSAAAYRVSEGSQVRVTVNFSGAAPSALQIPVTVSRGSAESGDYRTSGLSGGRLSVPRGANSARFTLSALQDSDTADETVNLGFGALPAGFTLGTVRQATVTIVDNDPAPVAPLQPSVAFSAARYEVSEGQGINIRITLSASAGHNLDIPLVVSRGTAEGGDYRVSGLQSGILRLGQGFTSQSISLTAREDDDRDDERVDLSFATLPAGLVQGQPATATVIIRDDDPALQQAAVPGPPANRPPVFSEGETAQRTVAEQVDRETEVGLPVTATDPDGDTISYSLGGEDAASLILHTVTGQIYTRLPLDLETKSTYRLTLTASDGRGGADSIAVTVSLADIQEVPITSPTTQSVSLVRPAMTTLVETPDGVAAVSFPAGFLEKPHFVRVESAGVDCGSRWPTGEQRAYLTVETYDTWGRPTPNAQLSGPAVVSLRMDAREMDGALAAQAAYQREAFRVFRYVGRERVWSPARFAFEVDRLGVIALTLNSGKMAGCFAAITVPAAPAAPSTGAVLPTPAPEAAAAESASSPEDSGRREEEPTPTPAVLAGAGPPPPAASPPSGPLVMQAGMGGAGEAPWWPRLSVGLGSILMLAALAWLFTQAIRDRLKQRRREARVAQPSSFILRNS